MQRTEPGDESTTASDHIVSAVPSPPKRDRKAMGHKDEIAHDDGGPARGLDGKSSTGQQPTILSLPSLEGGRGMRDDRAGSLAAAPTGNDGSDGRVLEGW